MSTPDRIVTINDLIPPRGLYCAWGVRKWFNSAGLDFSDFIKNGIPASKLLATNDHLAVGAVRRLEQLNEQQEA